MYDIVMHLALHAAEYIIRKGYCRYFFHEESIGGMLYLTNNRLCFRPHPIHRDTPPIDDIVLGTIEDIILPVKLGIFSQGIRLILRDKSDTIAFTVWRRKIWQKAIKMACLSL